MSGRKAVLPLTVLLALTAACGTGGDAGADIADRTIQVTTTTNWHTDLAAQIGGDRAEVTGLMAPGVDPHLYEAGAGDVETLAESDMAVWNGLNLEENMNELFAGLAEQIEVVEVGAAVPTELLIEVVEDGALEDDPHIWFDPTAWEAAANAVAEGYKSIDPVHAADYDQRLADYVAEIEAVDAEITELVTEVPEQARVLVTSHDAFTYFANAYGFEVSSIEGVSTAGEATTADIERVAASVADNQLSAVFIESSVPQQTIQAVLAAAAARGHDDVAIGGELFGDSLGDAGTTEDTWAGALRYNAQTIVDGLASTPASS